MTLRRFLSQDDGLKPSAKDLQRALIDATAELKTMPLKLSESWASEGDVPRELLALESSSSSMSSSSSSTSSSSAVTLNSGECDDAANTESGCDDDADDDPGEIGDGGDEDADDADDCDDESHIPAKKKPATGCASATAHAADDHDDADDSPVSSLHSSEAALLISGPSKKTTKKAAVAKTASTKSSSTKAMKKG